VADEHEHSVIQWVIGGIVTMTAAAVGWFNGKINRVSDKKLSKDVFEEFRIGNDAKHDTTHKTLDRIEKKLEK